MSEVKSELNISEEEVSRIFRAVNKSQNGQINFPEFLQASLDCNIIVKEETLQQVFKYLSKGTDGISVRHLSEVFGQSDQFTISDRQWGVLI